MVKLIAIGRCCRISQDMIRLNLKEETSLFEWNVTDYLSEINVVLKKMVDGVPLEIVRFDGNDWIKDTKIRTAHYLKNNYKEIVDRRAKRFINDIKTNKEVLFIRDDGIGSITKEEIDEFVILIKKINSNLDFKILVTAEQRFFKDEIARFSNPHLSYKLYQPYLYKEYIKELFPLDEKVNKTVNDLSDEEKE